MNAADEADFGAFVTNRSTALLSFAHVLTGDRHDAEDVVQTALAATALGWHRVRNRHDPEGLELLGVGRVVACVSVF